MYDVILIRHAADANLCYLYFSQSTETSSSNAMETEGLIRCHKLLEDHGVPVATVTTDRHATVAAFIRDEWPGVKHYFDTWHIVKGTWCNITCRPSFSNPIRSRSSS